MSARAARPSPLVLYGLGGAVTVLILAGVVLLISSTSGPGRARPTPGVAAVARPGPVTAGAASSRAAAGAGRGVLPSGANAAAAAPTGLVPDPESARSYPQGASTPAHAVALTPSQAVASSSVAPGAPSDAQVKQELAQMNAALAAQHATTARAASGASIDAQGNASAPRGAPATVAQVMAGANAIATFPYRFGGGHASFVDNAYDCSGSLSYALAAGGLVGATETSGQLMSWGAPGPGRWITVFATEGHTYMYVAGLRYDTSGRNGPLGSRWQPSARSDAGFIARHWPGL